MTRQTLSHIRTKSPLVDRAYVFSERTHTAQTTKSGTSDFEHAKAVADLVTRWELDEPTIAAALLHHILDQTEHTIDELKQQFGPTVATLVEGSSNIRKISYGGLHKDPENLRKLILHLGQDVRAMVIHLASRQHYLQTLHTKPPEIQRQIALETLEIHAPLAYRLGMYKVGGELEDLAFPYIYPQEYVWIVENLKDLYEEREQYAEKFSAQVDSVLKKNTIKPIEMHYRAKRYSSLYKKLLRYDMDIKKVYDLVALRIILNTVEECYRALDIIHSHWKQHPEGFDDYIAHPKPNGYQSLHTNIYGPGNKIIEIQIRTMAMHKEAEMGLAARFAYEKLKDTPAYAKGDAAYADAASSWIRKLLLWRKDPVAYSRVNIFEKSILVLSPKEEILELSKGATALDFAYKIHTSVGNHAKEAVINGQPGKLNTVLQFGDLVEIVQSPKEEVKEEWLKMATMSYTKSKIRAALDAKKKAAPASEPMEATEIFFYHKEQSGVLNAALECLKKHALHPKKVTLGRYGYFIKDPGVYIYCEKMPAEKAKEIVEELNCIAGIQKATYKTVKSIPA